MKKCLLVIAIFTLQLACKKNNFSSPDNTPPPPSCSAGRNLVNAQYINLSGIPDNFNTHGSVAMGNKIYFLVFENYPVEKDTAYFNIFNVVSKTWTTSQGKLINNRNGGELTVAGGKIFFAGGNNVDSLGNTKFFSDVDVYNTALDSWTSMQLSSPRTDVTGVAVQNSVLFAGGMEQDSQDFIHSSVVDAYDLVTGTWSVLNLSEAKAQMKAVSYNGKVFFIGGFIQASQSFSDKVEVYNHDDKSWSVFNLPRKIFNVAATVLNNKLIIGGGMTLLSGSTLKFLEVATIIDISSGAIKNSCLFQERSGATAVVVNSKAIITNGSGSNFQSSFFDIYDAAADKWYIGKLPENASLPPEVHVINNELFLVHNLAYGSLQNSISKLIIP
jgi:hypothetical protein